MEILLIENVQNLGVRGDVVNVKDGYARNFLLPRKKALPVTSGNLKMRAKELADAQGLCAKLEAVALTIAKKVGENGTLFGSVTNGDLADLLKAKGFELDKQSITVPHIKAIGTYDVDVRVYSGVHAKLHVEVTALAAE
jgi:large subunit ribosomal protein L9